MKKSLIYSNLAGLFFCLSSSNSRNDKKKQPLETIISTTEQLIKMESVSNTTNKDVVDFVDEHLSGKGFSTEVQHYAANNGVEKYNLVAKYGKGNGGFAFIAHADVVPGQADKWPAFQPEIKDNKLFGRGSCDMKGAIATYLKVIDDIKLDTLKQPLWLIITADEEIGSLGAKYMLKHSDMLKQDKPENAIIGEPSQMETIYAHKGWATFEVTARGTAMHTSTDLGESSNFKIAPFLAEMAQLKQEFLNNPIYKNNEFTPASNGFNITIKDFDGQLNVTSTKTTCGVSYRVMHNANSEEIAERIKGKARQYNLEVISDYTEGMHTDIRSELVKTCVQITGAEQALTAPYNTDGAVMNKIIKNLVILGPGNIEQAHTVGEFVEISELQKAYEVYTQLVNTFCR